jgi:hypothetical protein
MPPFEKWVERSSKKGSYMKNTVSLVSALSIAGWLGCSGGSLSESDPTEGDDATTTASTTVTGSGATVEGEFLGAAGGSATDKLVGEPPAAAVNLAAPIAQFDFAQLRNDRTDPGYINPSLPGNEWICAMSTIQGKMQDSWDGVSTVVNGNGIWTINVFNRAIGRANCSRLTKFVGVDPSNTTRWVSGKFGRYNGGGNCGSFRLTSQTWWGDSATILTGMLGGFYGSGEGVFVSQNADPWGPSSIGTALCQGGVEVQGHSVFIGVPSSGRPAKFMGPGGVGNAVTAGEYYVNRGYRELAPWSEAFCYFTEIRGAFAGDGEKAEMFQAQDAWGNLIWAMRATSGQGSLEAKARCYLYNQN